MNLGPPTHWLHRIGGVLGAVVFIPLHLLFIHHRFTDLFAAVDAMAKVLTESFHPLQVAWTRQLGLFMEIVIL